MSVRGKIRNEAQAQTLRDFSDVRWGKITPTDIDGFVEFGGKAMVLIEAKYCGAPLSYGQRTALERLTDAASASIPTLLVICQHSTSPGQQIPMASCVVTKYRSNGMWRIPPTQTTVLRIINKFRAHCGVSER